jgi:1-pyrroline-5-carboxylate dehydrogenase
VSFLTQSTSFLRSLTYDLRNSAPALVGNTILWKPSPSAIYANYITHQIFTEAGVPPGVIQFVPGPAPEVVAQVLQHRMFAALHFTGSTAVFRSLWKAVGDGVGEGRYCGYPRVVGETGGKNFHVVHESVVTEDVSGGALTNAVLQAVRGAFEYQGQKCSALSRLYVSRKAWEGGFKERLVQETANLKVGPPTEWNAFNGPVM